MTDNPTANAHPAGDRGSDGHSGEAPQFRFWSLGEVSRIGAVIGLLAAPFAAAGGVGEPDVASAIATPNAQMSSGSLRAVRIMALDVGSLGNANLADREN